MWPRVVVAVINKVTGRWTVFDGVRFFAWLWIWLVAYWMIAPSLQWPFASREDAVQDMALYAAGSVILPFLIGIMTAVKNNPFWREQRTVNRLTLHLYIYQGASIGFHLGYFVVFAFSLTRYYLRIQPAVWIEVIEMLIPLLIGYAGAQLVPHNLWRAYGRLHLKDGGIFFVFAVLGPFWAWFFFEFYDVLIAQGIGIIILLLSASMLAAVMAIQYWRKGNTIIPILWWIVFGAVIFICRVASLLAGSS